MSSSSLSSSLVDVNSPRPRSSGFEAILPTVLIHYEAGKEEENENENVVRFSFLLGKHHDRYLNIVVNEIILSKQHPLHYVIFTVKRWVRLIGWLNDMDVALKTINLTQRRNVPFCRPLGEDYYVRVFNCTQRVDFRRFYVPHGYKPNLEWSCHIN